MRYRDLVKIARTCGWFLVSVALAACGDERDVTGPDGGARHDAAITRDAAITPDATITPDAMITPDASTAPDAGPLWPPDPEPNSAVEVRTVDELLAALDGATPGTVVYVADGASLDLTGHTSIGVPARVTIAGNGGVGGAGGPLLFSTNLDTRPLFRALGEGVRFTGLRLRGPDTEVGTSAYAQPLSEAILALRADDLQVDHCELWGWSYAAIRLDYSRRAYVHHDSIHHNRRTGLGYGVVLVHESDAIIERNEFGDNRHDIAGTGLPGLRYVARYNRTSARRTGHAFDMHGENEASDNGSPYAGERMDIHHNTFLGTVNAIVIRGRPRVGAWIDDNCFGQSQSSGTAVIQRFFTGNLHVGANRYGVAAGNCHDVRAPGRAVRSDVNGDGLADVVTLFRASAYTFLGARSGELTSIPPVFQHTMASALFGGEGHLVIDVADVNGDLRADLVTAHSSGDVYVHPGTLLGGFGAGVASFHGTFPVATEEREGFEPIAIADVNADGFGDLVAERGGTVYVYQGRADATFGTRVESFATTFDSARFDAVGHFAVDVADVTGDERADLVTVVHTGTAYVFPGLATGGFGRAVPSFDGTAQLALLDGEGFEPIGVGDVDGDERGELVLAHTNGDVYVYRSDATGVLSGRTTSFAGTLATALFSGEGHHILAPLDVTGDGRADLVTAHSSGSVYVYPGTTGRTFTTGVSSFDGTFVRAAREVEGHELLSQKSALRRRGCAVGGCF